MSQNLQDFAKFQKFQLDTSGRVWKMLQNAHLLAKIGADTAENERILPKFWQKIARDLPEGHLAVELPEQLAGEHRHGPRGLRFSAEQLTRGGEVIEHDQIVCASQSNVHKGRRTNVQCYLPFRVQTIGLRIGDCE